MAMNIHVTVRYLQLKKEAPELSKVKAVFKASSKNDAPNSLHSFNNYLCIFYH